eukprot:1161047-Pelagomonas_calceolata.AAC.9
MDTKALLHMHALHKLACNHDAPTHQDVDLVLVFQAGLRGGVRYRGLGGQGQQCLPLHGANGDQHCKALTYTWKCLLLWAVDSWGRATVPAPSWRR